MPSGCWLRLATGCCSIRACPPRPKLEPGTASWFRARECWTRSCLARSGNPFWESGAMSRHWRRAIPLAVFIATLSLLWWIFGNRLILGTNDEGIYLDAAERILHGQKPYVDFFGYMSPGSFWMQALAFRVLGISLAAGRALAILYVALECGLIYWLVERFASRAAAIVTSLFFLAFQTADPSMLTAQHR